MIANYRNLRHRDDLMQGQLQRLKLRSELEEIYKRANIRRWNELEPSYEVPKLMSKPKEFETKFDVRERLIKKLQPFMVSLNEVITFTEYLEDDNRLDELDDRFDTFKQEYIKGARRLTATRMRTLLDDFLKVKKGVSTPQQILRLNDIQPPQIETGVAEAPQRRSAISSVNEFKLEEPVETDETGEMSEPTQGVRVAEVGDRPDLIMVEEIQDKGGPISLAQIKEAAKNSNIKFKATTTTKAQRKQSLLDKGYKLYDPVEKKFYKEGEIPGQGMRRRMCWKGYERVPGTMPYSKGSCRLIGSGMVQGMNHKSISNIPHKRRQQMFDAMVRSGWS